MSQICGWFDSQPDRADQRRRGMDSRYSTLLSGSRSRSQHANGGLYFDESGASSFVDSEEGVAVAMTGRPRWRNPELQRIAESIGHAAALARGYRQSGNNVVDEVAGAFAFAIADNRKSRLCLAIDRMGIIPMFLVRTEDGTITFGTSLPPVFANETLPRTVSDDSIFRFFYFHVVPSPATIFEQVSKLEPAQLVVIEGADMRKRHYWVPQPTFRSQNSGESEILRNLREETRAAVDRCNPDSQTIRRRHRRPTGG